MEAGLSLKLPMTILRGLCGLLAAAWITRDLGGITLTPFIIIRALVAACLLSADQACWPRLYRARYQRGSLDEVMGVGMAGCVMALLLTITCPALMRGQRAALQTVAGGAVFALPAMLDALYVLFAIRQRSRTPAPPAAMRVIVLCG